MDCVYFPFFPSLTLHHGRKSIVTLQETEMSGLTQSRLGWGTDRPMGRGQLPGELELKCHSEAGHQYVCLLFKGKENL